MGSVPVLNPWAAALASAGTRAVDYLDRVGARDVVARATSDQLRAALGGPMPDAPQDPVAVVNRLADAAADGTVATVGPRYFGFVVGGSVPAAMAADWLVSTWDQNAGIYVLSPLVSVVEDVTTSWVRDLVGLSDDWTAGFVTGCQMANFTCLAAARHDVLARAGWDVEADGLMGAPAVDVIVSDESHHTIFQALRYLGFGNARLHRIPTDEQGRMRADVLAKVLAAGTGPCIVSAQAGNVNTGAFDPIDDIATLCERRGAWLHVDSAFGLWAVVSPSRADLVRGISRADSISTDAHKWLNVPYDCGIAMTRHRAAHRAAMTMHADYIETTATARDPHDYVPELSRRARSVPVYAALASLGREGLRDIVERCCDNARLMAEIVGAHPRAQVLNDVVLNQVLIRFDTDEATRAVVEAVQAGGECWLSGTSWHGMAAIRVSVSNWLTSRDDIERSARAILGAADRVLTSKTVSHRP